VKSVDVFVVRVDARQSDVSDADADQALDDESAARGGWKTVATPNTSFDLLSLQNGIAATLGQAMLPAATYSGFRLIIDQSKSSATLKNGMVLSGGSTPGIKFPSAGQSGIKIVLPAPVVIVAGTETDLVVDFNVGQSFVMRGNTIDQNGLLFKPVVNASITNLALTNSNVRLANASDGALTLLQNGTALAGSSSIALALTRRGSVNIDARAHRAPWTGRHSGFTPTLTAGHPSRSSPSRAPAASCNSRRSNRRSRRRAGKPAFAPSTPPRIQPGLTCMSRRPTPRLVPRRSRTSSPVRRRCLQ
jgi:hypothetical protein